MQSVKKSVILGSAAAVQGTDQKLILTTSAGLLSGRIIEDTSESNAENLTDTENLYLNVLDAAIGDYDRDSITGNDGYILLTDASLRDGRNVINLGQTIVFYDQVISVSIGNLQQE